MCLKKRMMFSPGRCLAIMKVGKNVSMNYFPRPIKSISKQSCMAYSHACRCRIHLQGSEFNQPGRLTNPKSSLPGCSCGSSILLQQKKQYRNSAKWDTGYCVPLHLSRKVTLKTSPNSCKIRDAPYFLRNDSRKDTHKISVAERSGTLGKTADSYRMFLC